MTSQRDFEPPHGATRLLSFFVPIERGETIIGDFFEEFFALTEKGGIDAARRWYWRQTAKTILAHGRAHVLVLLFSVIGGWWLTGWSTRWSVHEMQTVLDTQQMYQSHPSLYLFLLKFPLELGRVLICTAIGVLIALIARKVEMAAVVSLALVQMALFVVAAVVPMAGRGEWLSWFLFMGFWNTACAIAMIAGGAIVRHYRSRTMDEPTPV
jgi:hypothetical protein